MATAKVTNSVLFWVILGIIIYVIWKYRLLDHLFNPVPLPLFQPTSPYDDCVDKNKVLPDGSSCTNCVPDLSGMPTFHGTIKSGVCVQIPFVPTEGSSCKTTTGNNGTITGGICVENPPAEGSACTASNGNAGTIKTGICVENPTPCTTVSGVAGTIKNCPNCGPSGLCQAIVNVGQKIKVINLNGSYAFEVSQSGSNKGCLQQQNPKVFLPYGSISTILEVKKDYAGCSGVSIHNLIRISEGWTAYFSNDIQIIN